MHYPDSRWRPRCQRKSRDDVSGRIDVIFTRQLLIAIYRVRTPPGNLEYSWIFIWNFSGPGKPGEMMLFFEI